MDAERRQIVGQAGGGTWVWSLQDLVHGSYAVAQWVADVRHSQPKGWDWERDYAGRWQEPERTGPLTLCTVRHVATLPLATDTIPPLPNTGDWRALTDWAHGVVSELVDALNAIVAGVTDSVTLVPAKGSR